jgi:putative NADH-flavin reductase
MQELNVLIVGVSGLGKCMVMEALERGVRVSVLVRNRVKLEAELGKEAVAKLRKVTIGDGTQATVLDEALPGIDVVLSGRGADPHLAQELAVAVKRHGVKKLCWPAGSTNVMADDGVTPNYKRLMHLGSWVEGAYRTHGACIDAIRQARINYVIFCPGRMSSVGKRSQDVRSSVRINRDGGGFVSYEDAAWVMLQAATTNTYDRELISAGTKH